MLASLTTVCNVLSVLAAYQLFHLSTSTLLCSHVVDLGLCGARMMQHRSGTARLRDKATVKPGDKVTKITNYNVNNAKNTANTIAESGSDTDRRGLLI